jgi:hypothetical protein
MNDEEKVGFIGLAYMFLALFGNGYARFACFVLFIASNIILKDRIERLVTDKYLLQKKIENQESDHVLF